MNKILFYSFQGTILLFIFFTMGCAKQHSVQVNQGSLSFYYKDAKAKEIFFASSADQFHFHPAIKGSWNMWQVTIPLNKEFVYFYIVDGEITIPNCPNTVFDDFGTKNCLYSSDL